jgi:hypothetical protein
VVTRQPKPTAVKDTAATIRDQGRQLRGTEPLPDTMEYDPATRRLKVGKGYIENVTAEIWAYEISGKQVLWHWFSSPTRPHQTHYR